jgi:general secretion pathway protein D
MTFPTQPFLRPVPFSIRNIAICALLTLGSVQIDAQTSAIKPGEPVTLNFTGAEIEAVARTLATLSGRNVVVDPRVKGTMTLVTERPVTPAAAWSQFLATLRLQGFTVVESAGLYKVVPEADAKLQSDSVSTSTPGVAGGQIVTQIFRLNYETANNLVPVLRPLISPNNTINVNPGNNSLVITDYADNLQRIARIIAVMDVANATDVEIIRLKHAIATDLAPLVLRLIESGSTAPAAGQGQADTSFKTTLVAEPRSNALILRAANPARMALVKSLIERLDQPDGGAGGLASASGNIHVVYLKNADAVKLAATLRAALSGEARSTPQSAAAPTGAGAAPGATSSSTSASQSSTGGQIQADAATNSLIITAPEPQYRQLRAVIDKLDARRAQVFIESLIAEVSADKSAELSVQWQGPIGSASSSVIGFLGTNFFSSASGKNIINAAQSIASGTGANPNQGMNIAAARKFRRGLRARLPGQLPADQRGRQHPVHPQPADTGQRRSQDHHRQERAVPDRLVHQHRRLWWRGQSVPDRRAQGHRPDLAGQAANQRERHHQDGDLPGGEQHRTGIGVVQGRTHHQQTRHRNQRAGGGRRHRRARGPAGRYLLGQRRQDPGPGRCAGLGSLFKSENRTRKKTNLMVFLRPVVLRDAVATDSLAMDRYELMRSVQQGAQPEERVAVPVNQAPVLPPMRAIAPAAPAAASGWGTAAPAER